MARNVFSNEYKVVNFAWNSLPSTHVGCKRKCHVEDVCELISDHKEADTRLLLHAKHVSDTNHHSCIVIRSPDTDVHHLFEVFWGHNKSIFPNWKGKFTAHHCN